MILKPKQIVKRFKNKWTRYWFSKEMDCTICNNKYCYIPILLNSHTIAQFQDICLYHRVGDEFIVYLLNVDEITKDLQTR